MNMQAPTKTITTPKSNVAIELFEWITGRKAEYIQEPILGAVKFSGNAMNGGEVNISEIDAKGAVTESQHREIESYVAKIGEETDQKKILELVLDMPDEDTQFVLAQIAEIKAAGKKKLNQ